MDAQQMEKFLVQMELKMAILGDDLEVIKMIVDNGADVNARTVNTSTLIFLALEAKKFRNVALLLELGANIGAVKTTGPLAGYSLLHVACQEGYFELVRLLLEVYNADPNAAAADSAKPIHLAILNKHIKIVNLLLSCGADIDSKLNYDFHEKYLSDSTWCNDFWKENSLLTLAVINDAVDLVKFLIMCNADVKIKSLEKKTLLMYAVENHSLEIVQLLLTKLNTCDVNSVDKHGFSAIHYLMSPDKIEETSNPKITAAQMYDRKLNILKELMKKGINVDAVANSNPDTLIINWAAYSGYVDMLEVLLRTSTSALARPLLYSLTSQKQIRSSYQEKLDSLEICPENLKRCIYYSLEHVIYREEMGLLVCNEEVEAMEKLRGPKLDLFILRRRNTIHALKRQKISTDGMEISLFDLVTKDLPIFERIILYPKFIQLLQRYDRDHCLGYFKYLIKDRLEAVERIVYLSEPNDQDFEYVLPLNCIKDFV